MSDGNIRPADGLTDGLTDAAHGGRTDRRDPGTSQGGRGERGEDGQRLSIYKDIFGNCEGEAGGRVRAARRRPKVMWAPPRTMMLHCRTKRFASGSVEAETELGRKGSEK